MLQATLHVAGSIQAQSGFASIDLVACGHQCMCLPSIKSIREGTGAVGADFEQLAPYPK